MLCKVCNKTCNSKESEDCFENALDVVKQHYTYYKNALQQRDLELKQVKERNEKLNKALELLQKNQQPNKRFKSQHNSESWLANNSLNEDRLNSDISLTDEEHMGVTNLNMAINSEQLFETSVLSPGNNNMNITSSEFVISPRQIESPKRNKQREIMRCLKDRNNKSLEKSKTEWHTKERNSPVEKSWGVNFLKPSTSKAVEGKTVTDLKKVDKRLCLSLKKQNPSKMKQCLIQFNKSKDGSFNESDICDDIIDASPVVTNKNSKAGRSWAHRSGQNLSSNNNSSNNSTNALANETHKKDDIDTREDDIVFDFSPTKKTDSTMNLNSPIKSQPKELNFDNDISTDCTALPNDHLGISTNKCDSSSVVILTPSTEDIIFVEDTCIEMSDIDTMDLLADIMKHNDTDNLENLKKYESKNIQKQQKQELQQFKKPQTKLESTNFIKPSTNIKQEKLTAHLEDLATTKENKTTNNTTTANTKKQQNPLFSNDSQDDEEDDEDLMPKPFLVKQEPEVSKTSKKLSFKERFNIDCSYCENYVKILGDNLTDHQIQKHINKCTRHNNDDALRQNTPKDFWNPFILSFQEDDPRNEVLIDTRFKDKNLLKK